MTNNQVNEYHRGQLVQIDENNGNQKYNYYPNVLLDDVYVSQTLIDSNEGEWAEDLISIQDRILIGKGAKMEKGTYSDSISIGIEAQSDKGISLGYGAVSKDGISIGKEVKSADGGVAIGGLSIDRFGNQLITEALNNGVAIGNGATTQSENNDGGVAIGNLSGSYSEGAAIGNLAVATKGGGAIGQKANAIKGFAGGCEAFTFLSGELLSGYINRPLNFNNKIDIFLPENFDEKKEYLLEMWDIKDKYDSIGIVKDGEKYILSFKISNTDWPEGKEKIGYELFYNIIEGGCAGGASSTVVGGGGAIGAETEANNGFAGGYQAKATGKNSVQLGTGTNSNPDTLQFKSYTIIDANGNIPMGRLSTVLTDYSKTKIYYGTESIKDWENKPTDPANGTIYFQITQEGENNNE